MNSPAERLQWAIESRGRTAQSVANEAGVDPSTLRYWLRGESADIGFAKLCKVCQVLAVSLDWIAFGEAEPVSSAHGGPHGNPHGNHASGAGSAPVSRRPGFRSSRQKRA